MNEHHRELAVLESRYGSLKGMGLGDSHIKDSGYGLSSL